LYAKSYDQRIKDCFCFSVPFMIEINA